MQFLHTYLMNTSTAETDVNILTNTCYEVASVQNVYHQPNALLITEQHSCCVTASDPGQNLQLAPAGSLFHSSC